MTLNIAILALVTLERLLELPLARRNTIRLLAIGAKEHSPRHYPLILMLHVAWLASLWLLGLGRQVHLPWLALFIVIELGRLWVLATLGGRWTTRIIVLPDAPLIRQGPYRFSNHPNYLVVIAEIFVLPLVFGLWPVSVIFSLLNAAMLAVRIRAENRALGPVRQ